MAKGDVGDPWLIATSGGDYTFLEDCLGNANTGTDHYIEIQGSWASPDTTAATIANTGLKITATGSAKHAGVVTNTDHHRLEVSSGNAITVSSSGAIVDGLVVKLTSTTGSAEGFRINASITVQNSIIYSLIGSTTNDQNGLYTNTTGVTSNITQCIIYGFSRSGICSQG